MKVDLDYLYGITKEDIVDMPYKIALQFKLDVGRQLLDLLYEAPQAERDLLRIAYVGEALRCNDKLLNELRE